MKSSFRYLEKSADNLVNIFLLTTQEGQPGAKVSGPRGDVAQSDAEAAAAKTALPLAKAFALAIRIANRNDTELVISGDTSLWNDDWGMLVQSDRSIYQGQERDYLAAVPHRFG